VLLDGIGGGTGSNNFGVYLNNHTIAGITKVARVLAGGEDGTGAITINGVGSESGTTNATGFSMANGAQGKSASGDREITGTGGAHSTGNNHRGVLMINATTAIESEHGNISITGSGGENTSGSTAYGVQISEAKV